MGLGDALADVMLEGRAADAESSSARARVDLSRARSALADQELETYKSEKDAANWKKWALNLDNELIDTKALCSGSLIVINAMIKVMERMQPEQREKFRDSIAQISRARIQELDAEYAGKKGYSSIANAVESRDMNKILGIL